MFKISEVSYVMINSLIDDGWDFFLNYGDCIGDGSELEGHIWECDFTRMMEDGLWDNHKPGYSYDVNEAIKIAYHNIRNGIKL